MRCSPMWPARIRTCRSPCRSRSHWGTRPGARCSISAVGWPSSNRGCRANRFRSDPTSAQLAAVASALARFHEAAESFVPSAAARPYFAPAAGVPPLVAGPAGPARPLAGRGGEQAAGLLRGESASPFRDHGFRLLAALETVGTDLAARLDAAVRRPVPLFPVLRDVHRDHVLITGEQVTGLIDPGGGAGGLARRRPRPAGRQPRPGASGPVDRGVSSAAAAVRERGAPRRGAARCGGAAQRAGLDRPRRLGESPGRPIARRPRPSRPLRRRGGAPHGRPRHDPPDPSRPA